MDFMVKYALIYILHPSVAKPFCELPLRISESKPMIKFGASGEPPGSLCTR